MLKYKGSNGSQRKYIHMLDTKTSGMMTMII